MPDKMTSKRNSRVFPDEAAHHGESHQQQKHHATATTYRSRRNSRSPAGREETAALAGQEPEGEKKTLNTVASRDSLSAVAAAAGNSKEVVAINMAHAKGRTRSRAPHVSQSHFANSLLADAPKSASSASSDTESMASTEGLPHNFGVVIPGVYRSSYPKPEHFRFMKELKLKTMVYVYQCLALKHPPANLPLSNLLLACRTLVKKDELDHELQSFVNANGIHQIIFNMKGTKKEAIPPATMKSILQVVLDPRNYPLLIHCNHGKHRTGCVVAAVRKIEGWGVKQAIDEYVSFAEPKIRDCDIDYIRDFQPSEMRVPEASSRRFTPMQLRSFARTVVFSTMVMLLWFVSGSQLVASRNRATTH